MNSPDPAYSLLKLAHDHDDMARKIHELVVRAKTLRASHRPTSEALAGLFDFASEFASELQAHIAEEESELFPQFEPLLTAESHAILHQIYDQHRALEDDLAILFGYLRKASSASPDTPADLLDSIYTRVKLLRYEFALHSSREQLFFETVNDSRDES